MRVWASVRNLTLAVGCLGLLGGCGTNPNARPAGDVLDRPEVTRSLLEAAAAAEAQNDFATAAGYYRNIYARDPNNVRAAVGLLQSLRSLGTLDQAREIADRAIVAKPGDPAIVAEVGKVRLATGQLQDAVSLLKRASELDPQDWRSRSALGVAYDRLGDSHHAAESYHSPLPAPPPTAPVLNNLALSPPIS